MGAAVAGPATARDHIWRRERDDLLRGITGGFLIGIPLLFTMETWWLGQTSSMPRAILFIAVSYVLNLAFVVFTGFRAREAGSHRPFGDALEATALAIVASAFTLALLHQIHAEHPLDVIVGRIAVNVLPVSIGISIANHILAPRESRTGSPEEGDEVGAHGVKALILDLGAAFAGALFLSLNIAATDEIPKLATEAPTLLLPAVILFSLLISYAIVFEAGFGGEESRHQTTGPFQRPITETVIAYLVSLLTAAGALWLYRQIGLTSDWQVAYAEVVILGLPAAIGAGAGRLAV